MTNPFYRGDFAVVDPVFFAVVPDSFMTRDGAGSDSHRPSFSGTDWSDTVDVPLVGEKDRWSF